LIFSGLVSNFFFDDSLVLSQALGSAKVACDGEHKLDTSGDKEGDTFLVVVEVVLDEFFTFIILFNNVLHNLCEESVSSELHDGKDDEEVDSNEGGHGTVEATDSSENTHYLIYFN